MNSLLLDKQHPANPTEPNKILHICSQCTRTFKDINNFREHLFQEHGELGVNVRQCHLCSYATLLKSKYDCHIKCHLNNRVIRCQKCNYSTINIRHMSKHERQHNLTNMNGTSITDENPLREAKRARRESENPPSNAQWPALYINTQIKEESIKITDKPPAPPQQKQQPPAFSSCFSTDKLLMPDTKKSPSMSQDKLNDLQLSRSLELLRSHSSHSTDEFNCIPCSHQHNLMTLRSNVWTLLRMLLPQLSLYHPSASMVDYESDHCLDRLVANLIQLPSFYGSYPAL